MTATNKVKKKIIVLVKFEEPQFSLFPSYSFWLPNKIKDHRMLHDVKYYSSLQSLAN